jgi:ribosome-associated protein
MIPIDHGIAIDENELDFEFVLAGGPGGQHVNKSSTAVQLRWDVRHSPSLPESVRQRVMRIAANRITKEGELIIEAREFRSQDRNRSEAIQRLAELVRRAAHRPKKRRSTRPTRASKERRLSQKRRHGEKKQLRGRVRRGED